VYNTTAGVFRFCGSISYFRHSIHIAKMQARGDPMQHPETNMNPGHTSKYQVHDVDVTLLSRGRKTTQVKKKLLPSVSFRWTWDKSLSGAYSAQALAGKMCLLRSNHRLSTTFVIAGSSL
jgi:hypothetical protein